MLPLICILLNITALQGYKIVDSLKNADKEK